MFVPHAATLGSPCNDGRHFYFLRPGWALICTERVLCMYQAPCIMVHLISKDPGSHTYLHDAKGQTEVW